MAVLEKRAVLKSDAYLKSAGELDEPAIDLAVAAAIATELLRQPNQPAECFVGELGLTGEVRRSTGSSNESMKLLNLVLPRFMFGKISTGITTTSELEHTQLKS